MTATITLVKPMDILQHPTEGDAQVRWIIRTESHDGQHSIIAMCDVLKRKRDSLRKLRFVDCIDASIVGN